MTTTLNDLPLAIENLRVKQVEAQNERKGRLRDLAFALARGDRPDDIEALNEDELTWVHDEAARVLRVGPALAAYLELDGMKRREDEAREAARVRMADLDARIKALQVERGSVGQDVAALARDREACAARAEPLWNLLDPFEREYAQQRRRALDAARARARAAQSQIESRGTLLQRARATVAHWANVVTRYQASDADSARMRAGADKQSAAATREIERLEAMNVGALREEVKAAEAEAARLEGELAEHWRELAQRYGVSAPEKGK